MAVEMTREGPCQGREIAGSSQPVVSNRSRLVFSVLRAGVNNVALRDGPVQSKVRECDCVGSITCVEVSNGISQRALVLAEG